MEGAIKAAATICTTSASDMPKELVNHLYKNGAFLIFVDMPEGTEFGIDYKSWNVGEKFLGMKMIPPGVHFIYYSIKTAPRIGFFHFFKEREVLIKKWDKYMEDIYDHVENHEVALLKNNLKQMDHGLAPYPYECYRKWYSLSGYITERSIERLRPENVSGRITGQPELVTMENEVIENDPNLGCSLQVSRENPLRLRFVDNEGLPIMNVRQGYEIRFSKIPSHGQIDMHLQGIDDTWKLEAMIKSFRGEFLELIAELQFAFVCFLMGQVYEGFDQWKRLILLLCTCKGALDTYNQLYMTLLQVIFFQLKECPRDFFVDIVTKDNFLTTTLSNMFANISDSDTASTSLKEKARKFKIFLTKTFKWNFDYFESAEIPTTEPYQSCHHFEEWKASSPIE